MNILVTGATGNVGGHVVRALVARGTPVRALVRDRDRAVRMFGPEVELAAGELADRESIDRALAGIDRVFLACGNVPGQIEYECTAIDAAAAAGVARVVKLSGPDASVDSPLIFERWHGEIERHLAGSGLPAVLLRPRTYLTNLLAYARTVAQTGMLFAPAGTAEISFVDPRDVAEAAAAALTGQGHDGKTYTLTGPEAITFERVAEELSAVAAGPVTYVSVDDEQARLAMLAVGLPPMIADAIVAIFASQRAGSMAGTTDSVRDLIGRRPRTIGEFVRDHAAAFRPAATVPAASR
jgi:uncharacterized protein YbjT (DUF2867 family)